MPSTALKTVTIGIFTNPFNNFNWSQVTCFIFLLFTHRPALLSQQWLCGSLTHFFFPFILKTSHVWSPNRNRASHPIYCKSGSIQPRLAQEWSGREVLRPMGPGLRNKQTGTSSRSHWEASRARLGGKWERGTPVWENRCTDLEIVILWKSLRLIWLLNFVRSILPACGRFQGLVGMSKNCFAHCSQ